jgi:hypothetical protein
MVDKNPLMALIFSKDTVGTFILLDRKHMAG